jgi:hypothetical protein
MSNTTRFRPEDLDKAPDGGSKFLGFLPVAIMGFEDKADMFDWADVFLTVTLQIEGSQYPVEMKIAGSYDRESNGNIKTCTLLKRLYWLFDVVGFQGGPDVQGNWVDVDGNPIEDLALHLDKDYTTNPMVPRFDAYGYVYKEPGRKDPSKAYTTVYPRLVANNDKGRAELESYIAFLKGKNLIKEADYNALPKNGSTPQAEASTEATRF